MNDIEEFKGAQDAMYEKALQVREKHARLHKKDYSHVFRKKSLLDILRLSAISIGIGIVYAAETAFVSPTLLEIGVEYSSMTLVWGLPPVLGLLFGPLLGSLSDGCRLNLGRRRPFILLLSSGMVIGLICLPFGRNIGQIFGDESFHNSTMPAENKQYLRVALIFTILGIILMDFTAETSQAPSRAYMIDVCIPADHDKALSIFSVMSSLGSALAYAIGGFDWTSTTLGQLVGGNLRTVILLDVFFFVVCFCVTCFSFREIPLPLIEKDKLLQPLTEAAIQDECLTNNNQESLLPNDSVISKQMDVNVNAEVETVSLGKYLKSILIMPRSLWILSLTNLFSWLGHLCYCLYFTDFVGEEVFRGDPKASVSSSEYNLYMDGVRFGGLGMSIYALTSAIYSFLIPRLMVWLKTKYVYVFGIMVFAIGMLFLAAWPSKLGVILASLSGGIVCGTINTIPFIIVAKYHAKGCFEMCEGNYIQLTKPRGLGTDIAIISSMLFLAQFLLSLSIGSLITWTGTITSIFYASSGLSVCAAVSAIFVLYI